MRSGVIAALVIGLDEAGFKPSRRRLIGVLAGHGVLYFCHDALVLNTGVPCGWVGSYRTFDVRTAVLVGGVLAFRAEEMG